MSPANQGPKGHEDRTSPSFDPLAASLHTALRGAYRELYQLTARPPSKWHRWALSAELRVRYRWLDYLLYTIAGALGLTAVGLFVASWPWQGEPPGYETIVIGCASTVGLGGVVLAAAALPVQRAAEAGPGLTSGLMRRARIWLLGISGAPLSVFLFWLASHRPDPEAALAAALLAGFVFAAYWIVARSALSLADPLQMARMESARLLKETQGMLRLGKRVAERTLRQPADADMSKHATADLQLRFSAGPILMLTTVAHRLTRSGVTDEAFLFLDSAVQAFRLTLNETQGVLGGYDEFAHEIVEGTSALVAASVENGDDRTAVLATRQLRDLAATVAPSHDVAEMRLQARGQLRSLITRSWDNMTSRVPAAASDAFGRLPSTYVRCGAFDEAVETLAGVRDLIIKAQIAGRAHIANPAMSGFISVLEVMIDQDSSMRIELLHSWTRYASDLCMLRLTEDNSWVRPQDRLIPGSALSGDGIQKVLISHSWNDQLADVAEVLTSWLAEVIQPLGAADQRRLLAPLKDALALDLFFVLLLIARRTTLPRGGHTKLAESAVRAGLNWMAADEERTRTLMKDPDIGEMLWSLVIASGCLADDPQLVSDAAHSIARYVSVDPDSAENGYLVAFRVGIRILCGASAAEADELADSIGRRDALGLSGPHYGLHIEPLGRAPSCNRNATVHFPFAVDEVNSWALRQFPALGPAKAES